MPWMVPIEILHWCQAPVLIMTLDFKHSKLTGFCLSKISLLLEIPTPVLRQIKRGPWFENKFYYQLFIIGAREFDCKRQHTMH